ncbi:putative mediator of RNA polymerase II transcription subunit 12 isoform X2 [Venturia canescens]|uniref:putative mediator of RNA polymerase II transcription subunit 12 isoform X2 n=1 Tax=Venturia canescens TaxID=32260 RepID=UPI001C9D1D09|nr:putative mediator of RNA polymerase II transcription subunit 12 isoform X2 [Venturia canescens]
MAALPTDAACLPTAMFHCTDCAPGKSASASFVIQETYTMSDQDDALLDEDLGDEVYDLGNDEEEALLADDYEIDRQNSYKGEEETDDVLDLGVTDALDDLEGEDENLEYRSDTENHNYNEFYKEEHTDNHGDYYHNQEEHEEIHDNNYDDGVGPNNSGEQNALNTVDLREKLQKNVQRKVFVGNGQGLEDDDCDEAEERRNRFQNERIMISPKMNHDIPDSLENVVTAEQMRQPPLFRTRGRGRGIRGIRGRFVVPGAQGNYIPRYNPNMRPQANFTEAKPFRPALLEGRPPMFPRMSLNNAINHQHLHHHQQQQQQQHQHQLQQQQQQQQPHQQQPPQQHQHQQQQIIYQQNAPQIPSYMQNGPPQAAGGPHFPEHRPPYNPNQFTPQGIPQGPRMIGPPRLEYRPRGPMPGNAMPRYNCPPAGPNFMTNQSGHFQAPLIPGNQGPSLLGTPGLNLSARLAWDPQQQQQPPPQLQPPPHQQQPPQHHPPTSGAGFTRPPSSYQGQDPYGQPPAPSQHSAPQEYQRSYQPVKSDDPYAYFSDVWQENKIQKPPTANKSYPSESTYSRDNYTNYGNKYAKSESTWEHRDSYEGEQRGQSQSYRDREAVPRPRIDNIPKQRATNSSNNYHHESYEQRPRSTTNSARPPPRLPIKRSPEPQERMPRQLSPKRVKTMNSRQEFRSASSTNENVNARKEEDVDPEMREYRKKMDEQKRLREKILQEKENRRKQAAMEKSGDESRENSKTIETVQQQDVKGTVAATGAVKDNVNPMVSRGRGRPGVNTQATEGSGRLPGVRIVKAIQTVETSKTSLENEETESNASETSGQANERVRQLAGLTSGTRRVVIQKPLPGVKKIATSVHKVVSNLQKGQTAAARTVQKVGQTVPGILKKASAGNGQKMVVNASRTIVQDTSGPLRAPKVVVNTLNNQRVVLQKSAVPLKRAPDIRTNTVKIENLAASTSESQIRRMCQGIGTLESIHMGDGNATIVFKTQSAALVFHKKYQRKMLDLSLINVRLIQQQTATN